MITLECIMLVQAIYFQYIGDLPKALEHFLESFNWQKAHSIFMTSVAHYLFLSCKYVIDYIFAISNFPYSYLLVMSQVLHYHSYLSKYCYEQ